LKGQVKIVMRRVGFLVFTLLLSAGLASAQVPTSGNVFFGYSYYSTDLSSIDRANTNGWEASVEGKVIPFLGFVADFDSHYGSQNFLAPCPVDVPVGGGGSGCPGFNADVTEHNFLFGPRVSFSVGKFRPFAEALFGAAHVDANNGVGSDTSFATALGGGLDYKIIRPVAWRFQGDYVQTRFFGATQNNVRLSTGIVFRF
jgi:opacity protein-like surface antigen